MKQSLPSLVIMLLLAVSTRLQGGVEIQERISVSAFGAKGNGTNDDTAAIQSALDTAAQSGGGTVVVPRGTFVITAPITIRSECTLEGIGGASVLKWGGTVWTNSETDIKYEVMLNVAGKSNIRIANMVFDAGGAGLQVIHMKNGVDTAPLIIENNRFCNLSRSSAGNRFARSLAIALSGGRTFTRNNYCDGASSDSFNYNSGWHLVSDNIIMNGEDGGIAFNNGAHGVISGNWISNCDLGIGMGHPGSVEQSKDNTTTITGNTIERCMLGINMGWFGYKGAGAPRNWTIQGNVFKDSACGDINYDGPERGFAANGAISGNISYRVGSSVHENFRHAEAGRKTSARFVRLANSDNVTITGNTVVEPQSAGALFTIEGSRELVIANNLIRVAPSVPSLSIVLLEQASGITVSANRVSGEFDCFLRSGSDAPVTDLHINDNVVGKYRIHAIAIPGALNGSEIIDNRFTPAEGSAQAINCPMAADVVIRDGRR